MEWGGFCGVVRCGRRCGRAKGRGYKRGGYIDVVGWLGDACVRGVILFALQLVLLERSSFPSARRPNGPGAGAGLLGPRALGSAKYSRLAHCRAARRRGRGSKAWSRVSVGTLAAD